MKGEDNQKHIFYKKNTFKFEEFMWVTRVTKTFLGEGLSKSLLNNISVEETNFKKLQPF